MQRVNTSSRSVMWRCRTARTMPRVRVPVARSRGMEVTEELWQIAQDPDGVVPVGVTRRTPVYSDEEALALTFQRTHVNARSHFKSFYSSVIGGITTNPGLMNVPMDDHMVHRGHAVFDTCLIVSGSFYMLDQHLERFFKSAEMAKIPLPAHRLQVRKNIMDTAAASCCENAMLRYWLSAGRGGFTLSGNDTLGSELYCICYDGPDPEPDLIEGWTVKTTPIPAKPAPFNELKSTNYLPNALSAMDAEAEGRKFGIWVDADGYIREGPNMNVGLITEEGVLKTPDFKDCLAGCTMARLLELVPQYVAQKKIGRDHGLEGLSGVEQGPIHMKELLTAAEVIVTGGAVPLHGVTYWDNNMIGDGTVGNMTMALHTMLLEDMKPVDGSGVHVQVPYGHMTGMEEDF